MKKVPSKENIHLPKVEFEQASVEEQAELFYGFWTRSPMWKPIFIKNYPELEKIIIDTDTKEENTKRIKLFVEQVIEKNEQRISESQEIIQKEWNVLNDAFLLELSKHFETEWPEDKKIMKGFVSILPVYPRFLDKYSFYVGFQNQKSAIETTAHEILHFLWFKKWKEVFPETPRNEYESPHLVWRLSEIMDPIILQCHPGIKNLIKPERWGYKSFENIKIGNLSMTEHFVKIYNDCVKAGKTFDETIKMCFIEAKKYEKEINAF